MIEANRPLQDVFKDDDVEVLPGKGKAKLQEEEEGGEQEKASEEMDDKRHTRKRKQPSSSPAKEPTPTRRSPHFKKKISCKRAHPIKEVP